MGYSESLPCQTKKGCDHLKAMAIVVSSAPKPPIGGMPKFSIDCKAECVIRAAILDIREGDPDETYIDGKPFSNCARIALLQSMVVDANVPPIIQEQDS